MNLFKNIQTDPALLRQLHAIAGKPLLKEEIEAQRVSFIYSVVGHRGIKREQIKSILAQQQGD